MSETIQGRELRPSDPYYGWQREDFTPFLQRLHNVLRRKNADGLPRLEGIGQSIKKTDFDSMLPDELKDDLGCKSYLMFNIASNRDHVAMWADDFIRFHLWIRAIVVCLRRGRGLTANPGHGGHCWNACRHLHRDFHYPGDYLVKKFTMRFSRKHTPEISSPTPEPATGD